MNEQPASILALQLEKHANRRKRKLSLATRNDSHGRGRGRGGSNDCLATAPVAEEPGVGAVLAGDAAPGARASAGVRPITVSIASAEPSFLERMREAFVRHADLRLEGRRWDAGPSRVSDLLRMAQAEVLVVDAELVAGAAGDPEVPITRAGKLPRLILVMDELKPGALDIVLASRARGCVSRNVDGDLLARAVRAAATGELWMPRWIMSELYARMTGSPSAAPDQSNGDPGHSAMTHRETDVLALARSGLTNKEIARRLDISPNTVKKHLHGAFEKSGLQRRRQIVV